MGMFGSGGLLSGLGGKFQDFMHGATPQLNVTPGAVTPGAAVLGPDGARPQTLTQMPQIQATGEMGGGFLDKLKDPDSRGLTFGDKLFAAGSVLQGDSGGAATYINNQRAAADALGERTRARDMAKRGADAFRNNLDPVTGELRFRGYLEDLGPDADPMAAMKMRDMGRPKMSAMSGPRGSLYSFNQDTGGFTEGVGPGPVKRGPYDEEGNLDIGFLQDEAKRAEMLAAARRRGAPPAGRSGGSKKPGAMSGLTVEQLRALANGG